MELENRNIKKKGVELNVNQKRILWHRRNLAVNSFSAPIEGNKDVRAVISDMKWYLIIIHFLLRRDHLYRENITKNQTSR